MSDQLTLAYDYAQEHFTRFIADLNTLLKIPSISTLSTHQSDVERAAQWLVDYMQAIGFEAQQFQRQAYLPIVYGEWLGAGEDAPTVLVYSHYDVQPAEKADGWDSDPFQPVERDGKIFARGAVDSKSHVMIQLNAVEALIKTGNMPCNVKLIFEGEEESGSDHIFGFIKQRQDLLKSDAIVVSDGSLPDVNQPVLDYGLRGLVALQVSVTGPQRDLHSGHFGGTVHNPIQALAEIMAQLHDENGTVTVPEFYRDVREISTEERQRLTNIAPYVEQEWKAVANAPKHWGESQFTLHERICARPTLEFNGIYGGFQGEGTKTVIPTQAHLKITCRLVPDQTPEHIKHQVADYIQSIAPDTVKVEVTILASDADPVYLDINQPVMQATHLAYSRGWGVEPLYSREGGSIPVVNAFAEGLNTPITLIPFGYKGGGAHSTNEYVVIDMYHKGIATMIEFYHALAELT